MAFLNPMRTVALLPLATLALALNACALRDDVAGPVAFVPLARGMTSALRASTDVVVARTPSEWEAAWRLPTTDQHGVGTRLPTPPLPVRFDQDMVIGVVLPAHSDSCTSVDIVGVQRSGGHLTVSYRRHTPQPDEVCLASFFSPYVFVTVPSTRDRVSFADKTPRD
jgi:hypothetical protein